ncbi:MAG: MotA/TolQ/ExbB proton channel family protein [Gammaproteobacteria bacterium]|jgi:biopolymer transport protein ExbB|nr:hypothetical protein [Gammaproteobacteria bacterium]MDP6098450.1 MotA/TolQ/ExbB proton channel family protein [Gammaproteobacteria bacterium]|tara:strand:+ start:3675 stop:5090 length:1416 start_codon:yes stop_codon:yes gene_type:complete
MRNQVSLSFCSILISSFFNVGLTTVSAQEATLEEVRESVALDLENSLRDLAAQRESTTEEKIPLVAELQEAESNVRELRNTATRYQAIRDSRELGLNEIQARLEAWENENTYLINLLNEYASRFQSNLNVSEADKYSAEIDTYNSSRSATEEERLVESQLVLLEVGLERIRDSFGGEQYSGRIVADDSRLISGTFTRFGPVVFFRDQSRELSGIVNAEDGINARILELDSNLDEIGTLTGGGLAQVPMDVTEGKVTSISSSRETLFGHISKGGIWIFPILFFALISLFISLYKALQIYRIKIPPVQMVRNILIKVRSADMQEALSLAGGVPAPVGPMLSQGVKNSGEPRELIEEVLYENILETRPKLGKLLPIIATTAAIAPLLGLLGTVTGMINTFNLISLFGTGDARVLSSGISEALVTTEFGLIVAIPALIIHALLSRKIKTILGDMEKYALIFSNGLSMRSTEAAIS